LPGRTRADFLRGDRLYTRRELASIAAALSDDDGPLARALRLTLRLPVAANPTGARGEGGAQGKLRLHTDPAAGDLIARLTGAVPVGRDGVAVVMAGTFRSEFDDRRYPGIETASVTVPGRALDVTLGRRPVRWGPGYTGALMLGDTIPALDQIAISKGFRLPGRLGNRIGPLFFEQLHGQFFDADDPSAPANSRGTRRDLAARRIETAGDSRWSLAYSEAIKTTRNPDVFYLPFLPWYAYQHDWSENTSGRWFGLPSRDGKQNTTYWMNFTASFTASYRTRADASLYADLLLDDIQAPGDLGKGDRVTRKTGFLFGGNFPKLDGPNGRIGLRVEAARIDPTTYESQSGPMRWVRGTRPIGYPTGPDARTLFVRLDARVDAQNQLALEGYRRRRRSREGDAPDADRLSLFGTHALSDSVFVGARLENVRWKEPGATARRITRAEVSVGAGW
jgi:hypothetical protein